jgi:hypothetical protein
MAVDVITEIIIDPPARGSGRVPGQRARVELVPGERLVMRTAKGPFPRETNYTGRLRSDARA